MADQFKMVCGPEVVDGVVGEFDLRHYNLFDSTPEGANCPLHSPFFAVMGTTMSMALCGQCHLGFP
jgi:hypothetical protein